MAVENTIGDAVDGGEDAVSLPIKGRIAACGGDRMRLSAMMTRSAAEFRRIVVQRSRATCRHP